MTDKEPITVAVDEDILDLVPIYLENRRVELETGRRALAEGEFETLRIMGHTMRGSGGGYGMDRITEIGTGLEEDAKSSDSEKVGVWLEELADFLERVRVVPE